MRDMTTTQGEGGESKEEVNEKVCFLGRGGTWQSIGGGFEGTRQDAKTRIWKRIG